MIKSTSEVLIHIHTLRSKIRSIPARFLCTDDTDFITTILILIVHLQHSDMYTLYCINTIQQTGESISYIKNSIRHDVTKS